MLAWPWELSWSAMGHNENIGCNYSAPVLVHVHDDDITDEQRVCELELRMKIILISRCVPARTK